MYKQYVSDYLNCSPILFSWPAPQNRCGQMERGGIYQVDLGGVSLSTMWVIGGIENSIRIKLNCIPYYTRHVQETAKGCCNRGKPKTSWTRNIKQTQLSLESLPRATENRATWRRIVLSGSIFGPRTAAWRQDQTRPNPRTRSTWHEMQLKGSVKELNMFHNHETEKITSRASDAAENLQLYRVVRFFLQRSSCTTHLMLFSERLPIYGIHRHSLSILTE